MMNKPILITICSAYLPIIIGSFTLFVGINAPAFTQDFVVHPSYVLDQWTFEDGLPVNNVVDILQV